MSDLSKKELVIRVSLLYKKRSSSPSISYKMSYLGFVRFLRKWLIMLIFMIKITLVIKISLLIIVNKIVK